MKTSKSLIRIIDKCFDNYKGNYTPYEIETNTTLLSFFKKAYSILKSGEAFRDKELVNTYINCSKEVIKTIRFIENSKIYKFKFTLDSSKGNPKAYAFLDCVKNLSDRYTDRNYDKKLLEEEQKIGYNNYYNENIYLSKGLIPSYNENEEGSVEFTLDDNPYLVKICSDGSYIIWTNKVTKKFSNYQSFKEQIVSMDKNDTLLDFYQTVRQIKDAEQNTEYFVTFAFEDGFTVNANNEYEQNNGLLLELFQYVQKSFEEKSNVLEKYLKQYFYNVLVEKYRTKEIIDKETNVKTTDITATNNFIAAPKVYENLMGKAGKIGSSNTIDYDTNSFGYIKFPFDKSTLNTDGKIYFYINKNYLSGGLKLLKNYDKIDFENNDKSFLYNVYYRNLNTNQVCESSYTNYFDNIDDEGNIGSLETGKNSNKQAAKYIKQYGNQIKENILKQNFFAIMPKFIPDVNDFFTTYYFQNVKKLEKEFYYNENYSSSVLDISFDKHYMLLSLQTDLRPEKDVEFGTGVLNTRKTQQKFYDNIVSTLSQTDTTTKDSNFKSTEFSSLFDDREVTVVTESDTIVANGQNGYINVRYDETGTYFIETNFPKYKNSVLYNKENELWLDCTNFSEYNDINSIKQVRIILMRDNTKRLLFNVDRVETEYIPTKINILELDIETPDSFDISYVLDNALTISSNSIGSNTNSEKEIVSLNSNSYENIEIVKEDNEDYYFKFTPTKEIAGSYLFDDEIIFDKEDAYVKNNKEDKDYTLVVNGEKQEKTEYEINKYLVLKNNSYTNQTKFAKQEECQILDFVSSIGNPKRKELGQFVYNSLYDNKPSAYEKNDKKFFLKNYPKNNIINIVNNNIQIILQEQKVLSIYKKLKDKVVKYLNNLSWVNLPSVKYFDLDNIKVKPKKINSPFFTSSLHKRVEFGNISKRDLEIFSNYMLINGNLTNKGISTAAKKFNEKFLIDSISLNTNFINEANTTFDYRKDKMFILISGIGSPFRESIIFSENAFDYKQIKQLYLDGENNFDYDRAKIYKASETHELDKATKYNKTPVEEENGYYFILDANKEEMEFKTSFAVHSDTKNKINANNKINNDFKVSFAVHSDTKNKINANNKINNDFKVSFAVHSDTKNSIDTNTIEPQFKLVLKEHKNES